MYTLMLESEEDREIFHKLYLKNKQKLYYMAWKIVQNDASAEDAVHTCFERLADRFAKYRGQPMNNLERLCAAIVLNEATNIVRHYAKRGAFGDVYEEGEDCVQDVQSDILEQLIIKYDRELMLQALKELSPEERHLLAMQYEMELKPQQIADCFGMSSNAIRKRMLRCRRKLAKILEDEKYQSLQK